MTPITSPALLNLDDLLAAIGSGLRPDYLLFCGHRPQRDGSVGKGCFSQWYDAPFVVDDVDYCSAEHFTGDKILVEASPVDPVWGIGLAAEDARAMNPATWAGLNLLGFALTAARQQLRAVP